MPLDPSAALTEARKAPADTSNRPLDPDPNPGASLSPHGLSETGGTRVTRHYRVNRPLDPGTAPTGQARCYVELLPLPSLAPPPEGATPPLTYPGHLTSRWLSRCPPRVGEGAAPHLPCHQPATIPIGGHRAHTVPRMVPVAPGKGTLVLGTTPTEPALGLRIPPI